MGRLSVQFDNKLSNKLAQIAKEKGVSKTEIIRRAIATYDTLGEEINDDGKIMVVKENKVVKQLIVP